MKFMRKMTRVSRRHQDGFTIVELMVAAIVGAIILAGAVASYVHLKELWGTQKEISRMYQKLRGSIYLMSYEFQMAGRSGLLPRDQTQFGLTDIKRYAPDGVTPDPNGLPRLTLASLVNDVNGDGLLTDKDVPAGIVTITYQLMDADGDGLWDLMRDDGSGVGPQMVTDDIEAFSLSYAFDANQDGQLDDNPPGSGNIIWAIDTDNDGSLDADLDANGDGNFNELDDTTGDGWIRGDDGAPLATPVPAARIRQVRMNLLIRAPNANSHFLDAEWHVVGDRVIPPPNDYFRRRQLTMTIMLRNREEQLQ